MSYTSLRYAVITFVISASSLLLFPIDAFSKSRLEILSCDSETLPSLILARQTREECGDRKSKRVNTRSIDDNKNGLTNDGVPSGGGSSGGGIEPPLPPEVPGRLIVEQNVSVTFQMSMVGFSRGNYHAHSHASANHIGGGNNVSAADLTYGIGVGVATNGQSTLLAIGGAFAGTVATTNLTQANAVSSGQGLGVTYAFTSPLPTPVAGEVIKVSQMISVVVNNTMPISSAPSPNGDHHEKRKSVQQASLDANKTPLAASVIAVDQAVLKAGATLSQQSSDALVSAVVLTGSTTIITGTGVTPVAAHAVGVAGGVALTTSQALVASSPLKAPIEVIQTLSVTAQTVIQSPTTTQHQHDTTSSPAALPSQTVDIAAIASQTSSRSNSVTTPPASNAPVVAETKAAGSGATNTQAASAPSSPTNQKLMHDVSDSPSKHEHHAGADNKDEKQKSSEHAQGQQEHEEAHSKDQKHDMKHEKPTAPLNEAGQKSAPKAQDVAVSTPTDTTKTPPAPTAPAAPSTAQASATGVGAAAVGSGALAAGAGAQAQSGAQSTGASQSSPAQAAASGASGAGAGAVSTTPAQSAQTGAVSVASTGATLQKP